MVWYAFLEDEEVQALTNERKCPECNNSEIAEIIWGYVDFNDEIEKLIESKKIVLGGCFVTEHDPKLECSSCHHRWGKRDE